jgi:queuine/archaeosine tRNA-ribosyltransferase
VLATHHSLYFYLELTREMRRAVEDGSFFEWKNRFMDCYTADGKTDRDNC